MDDMELLHRYVSNGDRDALSALIRKYQKMVFSACIRRLGCAADAEDATQQVFLAMMQSAGAINSSVSQWLYRCAINVLVSTIRARKNRIHREREKARQAEVRCGDGEAERKESYAILMHCLGELNATDQKVLVDNHVNGVTQRALASSMGVTQQAVAKRIGKVILYLRRELTSRGVIFSVVAAVLLAAKRAASAAIPEGLKAALTSAPSGTLASGYAAGAGAAEVLKVAAAAVLVMAAVATYECAEQRRSEASAPPARTVNVASAERPAAGGNVAVSGSFKGNLPAAAPISLAGDLPGQTVQQVRRASGPAASSSRGTPDLPASRRRFDVASNRWAQQKPPVGPQNDPDRSASFLSFSGFWGTSFGRRSYLLAAKAGKGTKPGADGSKAIDPSSLGALSGELADLAGGDAADELLPADASAGDGRRFGRRMMCLDSRPILRADMKEWDASRARADAIDLDAVPTKVAVWSTSSQRQFTGMIDLRDSKVTFGGRKASEMGLSSESGRGIVEAKVKKLWSATAVDEPIDEISLGYGAAAKQIGDFELSDLVSLSPFANSGTVREWAGTSRPSLDDSAALAESFVDVGKPAVVPEKWALSPAALQPVSSGSLTSLSKAITIADGALLAAAGKIDGRLINQGTVLAEGDASPLYLTGLVSGRGSYTGSVVFAGGFSPGNSPAAVHLDYAALDQGNTLTMELAGLTPGSQHDQLIIGNHLTLGGRLDVRLIYGFMPKSGDSFTLFDGDFSGKLSDMTLPTLNDGLRWDTSHLYAGGSLQVVPEPACAVLMALGLAALTLRRKR